MEPTQKPSPRTPLKEDDVDLGHLFYQTGGAINNFFRAIGRFFVAIGTGLLYMLFFLRRNIIWLALGAIVGAAFGFYLLNKNGRSYHSEMTVRANYNSSRSLYSSMDIFNSMVSNGQYKELAGILKVTEPEATKLKFFEANPVVSELITAELYKERFLNLYHNTRIRMDTFWIKTVKYDDFKSSLTKYDYPVHEVSVTSTDPHIFPKIQQGMINFISNNELLQLSKQTGTSANENEISLLRSSIASLDTLRNSYNKRLSSSGAAREGNNVTMLEGNVALTNPELQLYDKMLQLKDELKMVLNQAVMEKDVIQVYSPFGSMGQNAGFLQQQVVRYTLIGILLAIIITAAIAFYRYLVFLEKRMNKEKV